MANGKLFVSVSLLLANSSLMTIDLQMQIFAIFCEPFTLTHFEVVAKKINGKTFVLLNRVENVIPKKYVFCNR